MIMASANSTYSEPPVTVKKKTPTRADTPSKAITAVTIKVVLSNIRAPFFVPTPYHLAGTIKPDLLKKVIVEADRRYVVRVV